MVEDQTSLLKALGSNPSTATKEREGGGGERDRDRDKEIASKRK